MQKNSESSNWVERCKNLEVKGMRSIYIYNLTVSVQHIAHAKHYVIKCSIKDSFCF